MLRKGAAIFAVVVSLLGCKHEGTAEAEAAGDVAWLAEHASTPEAVAALGRLADRDAKALAALQARPNDVNVYIAAWMATKHGAPWGTALLKSALSDPERTELAGRALPRRDPRLIPLVPELEAAVVRLAAGHRGSFLAGVLASVGPEAHAAIERRLVDTKTRGAMCDGISLPEASGDAKSTLLWVSPEGRDHPTCVAAIVTMAATEDVVLGWLASGAEPGLLSATAKSTLPCPRLATLWVKGLAERPAEAHAALTVPLQLSINRCSAALDPVLADLLTKAPAARSLIVTALEPDGGELAGMKQTCATLGGPLLRGERGPIRDRAADAVSHGCRFAR